jgi:uncharacterized membrane protein
MQPVESSVVISQPIQVCFAYLSDLANDVEWRREWVAAEKTSEGPADVGARYRLTGQVLGRPAATVYEAIAYEPNRLAAWTAVSGPLPLTFSRAFEVVDGGTRVTMRYEMEVRGLVRLAAPLLARMGRRQMEGDFPKLKQVMESATS